MPWLREVPAVEVLRRIWVQQFWVQDEQIHWRSNDDIPPASKLISSPYDPEARMSIKRSTLWTGYKVHLTETCDEDLPHLILHVENICDGLVKPVCPKVVATLSIYELYVNPQPLAATLYRSFDDIAYVQFAPQLLHVNGFALERKRRVACNHERTRNARQIRGQTLGYPVHEVFLLGIAADVCEWQHHDGQVRN